MLNTHKYNKSYRFFCSLLIFFVGAVSLKAADTLSYEQQMQHWYQLRRQALLAPDGWVNLAGLFWLQEGENCIGSDPANSVVFKGPGMPAKAGCFILHGDTVNWVTEAAAPVEKDGRPFQSGIIFTDHAQPVLLALDHYRWNIIRREDKIGVRFRDLEAPAVLHFKPLQYFPLQKKWRIPARLEKKAGGGLFLTNVLGQTSSVDSPGQLVFTIDGTTYRFDTMAEGDELFIVFGDATSGKTTYEAGRFIYAPKPDAAGNTWLDFNQAFNPPCAFTKFATCPLPPKQNILPVAVTAGEKNYE